MAGLAKQRIIVANDDVVAATVRDNVVIALATEETTPALVMAASGANDDVAAPAAEVDTADAGRSGAVGEEAAVQEADVEGMEVGEAEVQVAADPVEAETEAAGPEAAADTDADLAAFVADAASDGDAPQASGDTEAAAVDGDVGTVEAEADDDDVPTVEARPEELRLLEALLFAASEPLDEKVLAARMPDGVDVRQALRLLQADYAPRGVNLVRVAGKWTFRTANDLAWLLAKDAVEPKKLSRAALETLSIIAYHQPVTRAEIEDIRGVSTSKGTLDVLLETGWIRPRGRRKTPGRPITFGTSEAFLAHFGLERLNDLPGLDELKGTGLLDGRLPPGFSVPVPSDDPNLREDEDPLEDGDLELNLSLPAPEPESEEG